LKQNETPGPDALAFLFCVTVSIVIDPYGLSCLLDRAVIYKSHGGFNSPSNSGGREMGLIFGVLLPMAVLAGAASAPDTAAIIVASTNVNVSFAMAIQMLRFVAILIIGPALAKYLTRRVHG
jgi:hypothetical protein